MKGDAEEWLRIRWEFMREARECKEVFDKIRDIQKCGTYTAILIEEITNNLHELGLNFPWNPHSIPVLPDPNKSFDEFNPFEVELLYYICDSKAVTTRSYFIDDKNQKTLNYDGLIIDINFNEVNSVESLKQAVCAKIELAWKFWEYPFRLGYRNKKKTNRTDFDKILKIGRLKKENPKTTYRELAEKVFPKEMGPESPSPESAIKKTKLLHKRYKELTEEGGWRNLKFP